MLLTVSVFALYSCANVKETESFFNKENNISEQRLDSTKWLLVKVHGDKISEVAGKKAFIRFDVSKNRVGGNGSCNMFRGSLAMEGNKITVTNIFSTKMYCEGVQDIENSFLDMLGKATRYEIKENRLFLYTGDTLVLEFIAE
jgi:heat shock protein HslJ